MAGVTNVAFRTLCRELEMARAGTISGLYVCEMVTARALVERHPVTMHMTTFAPDETPRSLQLYTVDPETANGWKNGRTHRRDRGRGGVDEQFDEEAAVAVSRAPTSPSPRNSGSASTTSTPRIWMPGVSPSRRVPPPHRIARPHRGPALLRRGRLVAHRRTQTTRDRHPRAGQRRHLRRS